VSDQHRSLRERLVALASHDHEPTFEPSADPTLLMFAELFRGSALYSLDANKRLRSDALSPIYDCETESRATSDSAPDRFVAVWTPVWQQDDPVSGFRTGRDSAYLGSTPTVAMPQDERTAALLLLVSTTFVHLSASDHGGAPLVQGAVETDDNRYRFLRLDQAALSARRPTPGDAAIRQDSD
jgi:hypothetical protein